MKYRQLQTLMKRKDYPDEWWLAVEGEVDPDTVQLNDLMVRRKSLEGKFLQLLNIEDAESEHDLWVLFEYGSTISLSSGALDESHAVNLYETEHSKAESFSLKHKTPKKSVLHSSEDIEGVFNHLAQENRKLQKFETDLKNRELSLIERERSLSKRQEQFTNMLREILDQKNDRGNRCNQRQLLPDSDGSIFESIEDILESLNS